MRPSTRPSGFLQEVDRDWVLSLTGAGLCVAHVISAYLWYSFDLTDIFSGESWSSCYPFFSSCNRVIRLGSGTVNGLLGVYAWLALVGSYFFIRRANRVGAGLLLFTSLIKLFIYISRYDFMGNYHLMHFTMLAAFFLLPMKRTSLLVVLCVLYFWAGFLKFNVEWLSGAALLARPWLQGKPLLWALGYVPVMETVLVWGLLSRECWIRMLTAVQLAAFHAFSWHIVGYMYPMTMASLLVPVWASFQKDWRPAPLREIPRATWIFVFCLSLVNLLPKIGGDPALDGAKRVVSLTMLDARTECRKIALIESPQNVTLLSLPKIDRGLRLKCDHLIFEGELSRFCRNLAPGETLSYVDFAKRTTDSAFSLVRAHNGYCHEN